jgi:NADPH-dependent F420 reductase
MNTKQVVAVIGASGNMGSAIAKAISKGNYRVLLQSENLSKVQCVVDEIRKNNPGSDVDVVVHPMDASWEADIIILAIPYVAEKNVAQDISEVVNQKIVISVSNPVNASCTALLTSPCASAAEELQNRLPYSKVIKAFNNTSINSFSRPFVDGQKLDCFIAGNDEDALQSVYDLVKAAGFNPVIVGDLAASRTLESMQLLLIQLSMENNYNGTAGWKVLHN